MFDVYCLLSRVTGFPFHFNLLSRVAGFSLRFNFMFWYVDVFLTFALELPTYYHLYIVVTALNCA